jgi:chorismate-pyruvate lyase
LRTRPTLTLLYPLDEFYAAAGLPAPGVAELSGDAVPEPYHSLLVHQRDMTPTLEAHYGDRIHLRLIERRERPEALLRQVVLALDADERPVEYGAIAIHLGPFPAEARELVLGCRCPLGTILARHAIPHVSRPRAYFRVTADARIAAALQVEPGVSLYGRRNVLSTPEGAVLADVVEVLPPAP